jgi:hypothetical protein
LHRRYDRWSIVIASGAIAIINVYLNLTPVASKQHSTPPKTPTHSGSIFFSPKQRNGNVVKKLEDGAQFFIS